MSLSVPFLSEAEIDRAALTLLRETGLHSIQVPQTIVPVEDVLEKHLRLSLDFDDLHTKLGVSMLDDEPEILGALWVESREVFIDQSPDPHEHPEMDGRYRFTLGHEIGHWWLHRSYLNNNIETEDMFDAQHVSKPTVICRASNSKDRIEWQADTFASSFLMPAGLVYLQWREAFSRSAPLIFEVFERDSDWTTPPMGWKGQIVLPSENFGRFDPRAVSYFFFRASSILAPRFGVSVQAMRVRLQRLGLLLIERPELSSFTGTR